MPRVSNLGLFCESNKIRIKIEDETVFFLFNPFRLFPVVQTHLNRSAPSIPSSTLIPNRHPHSLLRLLRPSHCRPPHWKRFPNSKIRSCTLVNWLIVQLEKWMSKLMFFSITLWGDEAMILVQHMVAGNFK